MVINIVGSGTATYGEISDGGDWLLNNGSSNCSADFSIPVQTSTVTLSYNGDGNVPEFDVDLRYYGGYNLANKKSYPHKNDLKSSITSAGVTDSVHYFGSRKA